MAEPTDVTGNTAGPAIKNALPTVSSPPLSPGDTHKLVAPPPAAAPDNAIILTIPAIRIPKIALPKFKMPQLTMPHIAMPKIPPLKIARRTKRNAVFVASLMAATCVGALTGALAIINLPPKPDAGGIEERAALQKSVEHLSREIGALKSGVTTVSKSTNAQLGKVAERIERIERAKETSKDVTGSIATPPPVQVAAVPETPMPPPKPQIVSGWTVVQARDGGILVEGRGELYLVRPGVPLPGLGAVESVKREGGRWVVTTPKGIIVSDNSAAARPRGYYPPYYRPY